MVGNELLTQICWCRHFIYRSSNNSRRRIPLLMPVLNRSSPARSLFCPLVSAYNQASWSNRHSRGWGQALRRISSGREESAQFPGAHARVYRGRLHQAAALPTCESIIQKSVGRCTLYQLPRHALPYPDHLKVAIVQATPSTCT